MKNLRTPFSATISIIKMLILILFLPFTILGQGTLNNLTFFSPSLNMDRNIQVYLPEGYDPQDSIRYPVVYFLHGVWDDHTFWGSTFRSKLDSLIGNSIISPMILIKPDGSIGPWDGSFYTNSELYGDFEDYIVFDLVSFIDTTYKTIPSRGARTIFGHSMGGFGSMKLAIKHPDLYCAVASLSGHLDFNHWLSWSWVDTILFENGGVPVSNYVRTLSKIATYLFYNLSGAFSPNLNNPPYYVDFPLDSMGNFIDSTFNRWLLHDPARLVSNLNPNHELAIYFDCGEQDELFFYPFNLGFKDSLDMLGLEYTFESFTGTHLSRLSERIPIALIFLDSVMNTYTGMKELSPITVSSFLLSQNYPNPFNPTTNIEFSIPKSEFVTLKVYNILGEEVATLVSEKLSARKYKYDWNASSLASGVYLYRIQAGNYVESKKMLLIR